MGKGGESSWFCWSKNLVWASNCCTFFAGLALIGLGIWSLIALTDYLPLTSTNVKYVGAILISIGSVLALMGFLGCCGAMKEDTCMLNWFFNILLVLVILEIAAIVLGYVYRSTVSDTILAQWNLGVSTNDTTILNSIAVVQVTFSCCGLLNYTYWDGYSVYNYKPPNSCCTAATRSNSNCMLTPANLYQIGCQTAFDDFIQNNLVILASVCASVVAIQILGMIMACIMIKHIKQEKYDEQVQSSSNMRMKDYS